MGFLTKGNQKKQLPVSKPVPQPAVTTVTPQGTVIGAGITIEGTVHAGEDMIISGCIKGQIKTEKQICVEPSGRIEASINCTSIIIRGEVKGDISAVDSVTIESNGRVTGDIRARVFSNQPGGFFEGYSHMIDLDKPAKPKDRPKEKSSKQSSKREDEA